MRKGLIIIVLAIMAVGYISCEKKPKPKDPEIKDYRDKWVGDWDFEVKPFYIYYEPIVDREIIGDTILSCLGKITYGNTDYSLNIDHCADIYHSRYMLLMDVDPSGQLERNNIYTSIPYAHGYFDGNNKVHIEYSNGSLAGHHKVIINGTKIEKDTK